MTFISRNAPLRRPKMTPPFSGWTEAIKTMVRRLVDRHIMMASLNKLSDKNLRDIGLTRNDVSSTGVLDLSNIAKSRSGNW